MKTCFVVYHMLYPGEYFMYASEEWNLLLLDGMFCKCQSLSGLMCSKCNVLFLIFCLDNLFNIENGVIIPVFFCYCCSNTIVCIFPPLLPPNPSHLYLPPLIPPPYLGFVQVSFIVVSENPSPLSPHYPLLPPFWLLSVCS